MAFGRALARASLWLVLVAAVMGVALVAASAGPASVGIGEAQAAQRGPAAPALADPFDKPAPAAPIARDRAGDRADLGEVSNAAGERLDVEGVCAENLAIAAKQGLKLPDGWAVQCPGPGLDWEGGSHWGVTCPYDSCPEGAGPYVSISNPNYYVVAHELCHANFGNDELMADSCAAEHGASLETSPYQ